MCTVSRKRPLCLTSLLLADELLFTEDVLWPTLGVLRGESVVPFTAAALDVPFVVTVTLAPVIDEVEVLLLMLPAVLVAPLASLNLSAN